MVKRRVLLPALFFLTASLLSGCGLNSAPSNAVAEGRPGDFKYLHTLSLAPGVSKEEVQQRYGGYVVSYRPEEGTAVIATNAASLVSSSGLGVLDLAGEENTSDYDILEQGVNVWASGFGTWANGFGAWSSGFGVWNTGTVSASTAATTFKDNLASWNAIKLSQAQSLVPELGQGIKIAVLDTGIDLAHPAFKGKVDRVNDYDFIDGDQVAGEVNSDTAGHYSTGYGHGTAVASLVLQMAPNATILPIRVLNSSGVGDTATIIAAINYAVEQGARIINLSLGSPRHSSALDAAVRGAVKAGVIVVCAAGNTGDTHVIYPAASAKLSTTVKGRGSVSVGSVNDKLLKSSFSTYGDLIELMAPGEKLLTAFPGSRVARVTGTSFSAPVVSGVLALALSSGVSTANAPEVAAFMSKLDATATTPNDPNYPNGLGYGTINAYALVHQYR